MKKLSRVLLAAVLAAALVFSLVACAGGGSSPKGTWTIGKINGVDLDKYIADNTSGEDGAAALLAGLFSAMTFEIDDKNITMSMTVFGETQEEKKPYTANGNELKTEDGTVFKYVPSSDTIECSGDTVGGGDEIQSVTLKRK